MELIEPIHAAASIKAEDISENEETLLEELRQKINESHISEIVRRCC